MLPSTVMGTFPFRVNDRPFADFDYAVARYEPDLLGCIDEIYVSPLVAVVVDVVSELAKQNAFRPKNSVGLFQKRRKRMAKGVVILFGGLQDKTKTGIKIL